MYFENENFLDAFAVSFGLFVQYILIYRNRSWTELHYENTVTDDAVKVTLIKMVFPLWKGQGNPSLSVKKWPNPPQSETPPNKFFVPYSWGIRVWKKVNKVLAKWEKKICLQCAFLQESTIHDHDSLSQAENF